MKRIARGGCGYGRRPFRAMWSGGPYNGPYAGPHDSGGNALAILEERFARGEIDKATFEDMRKSLGR